MRLFLAVLAASVAVNAGGLAAWLRHRRRSLDDLFPPWGNE